MRIQQLIQQFHDQINLYSEMGTKENLLDHGINVTNLFNQRKIAIKVRNFHYRILSCEVYYPRPSVTNNHIRWQQLSDDKTFYLQTDMKQLAIQVLYFLNIPYGECIVQRDGKKSISIYEVKSKAYDQITPDEEKVILEEMDIVKQVRYLSFGADVEVLIRNMITKRWVNAASLVAKEGSIGYDSAIALFQNRVTHPVLELRPKYAYSGEGLHNHLLREYNRLEDTFRERELEAVGGSNPYGRYLLGGHLHLGNQPLTYKHVRVLDEYLALPYALLGDIGDEKRREQYGRLGNVRRNLFQGFEYRTLSSWYEHIPDMLPMLNWFEFLCRNSEELRCQPLPKETIRAYYTGNKDQLYKEFSQLKMRCQKYMNKDNYENTAIPFFQWIEAQLKK